MPVSVEKAAEAALLHCELPPESELRQRAEGLLRHIASLRAQHSELQTIADEYKAELRPRRGAEGRWSKVDPERPSDPEIEDFERLLREAAALEVNPAEVQALVDEDWIPLEAGPYKPYAHELRMVMNLLLGGGMRLEDAAAATTALLQLAGLASDLGEPLGEGTERVLSMRRAHRRKSRPKDA